MSLVLGIDPGSASGALCLLGEEIQFFDIEKGNEVEIAWWFRECSNADVKLALIERVGAFPGQGVSSAFNFGAGVGILKMGLRLSGWTWQEVSPVKWQEGIPGKPAKTGKLATDRSAYRRALKRSIYDWVRSQYPEADLTSFSKHSDRADALAIAHYAKTLLPQYPEVPASKPD